MSEDLYEKILVDLSGRYIFMESHGGELSIFGYGLTSDDREYLSDMFFEYTFLRHRTGENIDLESHMCQEEFFHADYYPKYGSKIH